MAKLTWLGAAALAAGLTAAPSQQSRNTFVGTTPCHEAAVAFVGGMTPGVECRAIQWELTLGAPDAANRWSLRVVYAIPAGTVAGANVDGPTVTNQGPLTRSTMRRLGTESTLFRLTSQSGSSIAFAQLGADLVNLAGEDGSLVPGNAAASFALTRADRLEPPAVEVPRASEGSYTVPPKEVGAHVLATYIGRTPCTGLARALKLTGAEGCVRLKWRLQLLRDPVTNQPTKYIAGNSLTRDRTWTGAWRIVRGAPGFPDATMYQLDGDASHGPISLLRLDDNIVVFLDQQRQLLPGNAILSYALTQETASR